MELYFPAADAARVELFDALITGAVGKQQALGRIDADVRVSVDAPRSTRNGEYVKVVVNLGVHRESRRGEGRRSVTAYGHSIPGGFTAQGTFDEYGWMLAELYSHTWGMVVGRPAAPVYAHRADFEYKTGLTYNPHELLDAIWPGYLDSDPFPFVRGKQTVGYAGRGRTDAEGEPAYVVNDAIEAFENGVKPRYRLTYAPRTREAVRAWAKLDGVGVQS